MQACCKCKFINKIKADHNLRWDISTVILKYITKLVIFFRTTFNKGNLNMRGFSVMMQVYMSLIILNDAKDLK
jgi:hypothetical protein